MEYTKAIYEIAGYDVDFKAYPWSRAILNTEKGRTDALLGATKDEVPNFVFPETEIGTQQFCFFSLKEDTWKYEEPESVIGRTIIHPQNALPRKLEKYRNQADFVGLPSSNDYRAQIIGMLRLNRADSILADYYVMMYHLNKNDLSDHIKVSGCLNAQSLYLAFSPDPKSEKRVNKLIAIFDREIKVLQKEKHFEDLLSKYELQRPEL